MTEKMLSLKVLTPIRNLEIYIENDRDIGSTQPLTYERFKAVGRSFVRTGVALITTALYIYSVGQIGSHIREYFTR